jgi:hypothetical protein
MARGLVTSVGVIAVAALMALGAFGPTRPARADIVELYFIYGTVRDNTGIPIDAAAVSDGTRSTLTDAAGNYRLPGWTLGGTHVIRVTKQPYASASRQISLLLPGEYRADFVLQP